MEDNIKVARSRGKTCFKCEMPIRPGETVISFSFNVSIPIIGKYQMSEEGHVSCVEEFCALLRQRVTEACRRNDRKLGGEASSTTPH
jgi:hypothetical protein